jgi:Uma2 family endonuclease
MTIEEFLSWQTDQEDRFELVDGQPVAMAGAKLRHDRMAVNAISEIRRQLRATGSPCDAFTADIGILTPPGHLRRPEVSVLCPPFDEEAMTSDSPRLIVEVLSESTARVDRLLKLDEYKAIDAMAYIVIADPARVEVGFWFRDAERAWRSEIFQETEAVIGMPALDLAISLASLYERVPLPPRPRRPAGVRSTARATPPMTGWWVSLSKRKGSSAAVHARPNCYRRCGWKCDLGATATRSLLPATGGGFALPAAGVCSPRRRTSDAGILGGESRPASRGGTAGGRREWSAPPSPPAPRRRKYSTR